MCLVNWPGEKPVIWLMWDFFRCDMLTKENDYPEEVRRYLQPSAKIESDSPLIQALAAEIIDAETDIVAIAEKSAAWIAQSN